MILLNLLIYRIFIVTGFCFPIISIAEFHRHFPSVYDLHGHAVFIFGNLPPTWEEILADPGYSHGYFTILDTGDHTIRLRMKQAFDPYYGGATVAIIVNSGPCPSTPAPEFPSAFLPVAMIIGFVGAVLIIQRTREN